MSKNDMRMNIHIDGDNKGFKRALGQTKRDINQFEKSQGGGGVSAGELAAVGGVAGMGVYMRRSILRNSAKMLGLPGNQTPGRVGTQAALGALLANPKLQEHTSRARKQVAAAAALPRGPGLATAKQAGIMKDGRIGQGTLAGADIGYAVKGMLMAGTMGAAISAASVAAFAKMSSFGRKELKSSTQFSATASMAQAMKDQRDVQRQMAIGNSPFLMEQQARLIASEERREQAGANGFGYIANEAEIDINNFIAALKEFTAGVLGSDDITSKGVVY